MAALSSLYPTLLDLAKKMDAGTADVVELLEKNNAHLQDIAWQEGNLPTGHKFPLRTALPSPAWRKLNAGVAPSKGQIDTMTETCGMLEGFSKVDSALARLSGNPAAFRKGEDDAFAQSFGITVASALFYSDLAANPEQIQGFAPRMGYTSGNPAAANIIKAADAGGGAAGSGSDQTSMWFVGWGPKSIFGIFPKGSAAGLSQKDLGEVLTKDAGGTNEFLAFVTHHKWDLGLCVQDWRKLVRVCNIDTGIWKADLSTGTDLVLCMLDGDNAMDTQTGVQPVWYHNRKTFAMFNKQLIKKGTTNLLEYLERGGRLIPHFLGNPIRIVDALTITEDPVV